jgi:hypothetical protein
MPDSMLLTLLRLPIRSHQQNRNRGLMAHFIDRAAENEIAEQAMPVSGHGDEIAFLLFCRFEDFGWWIAQGKLSCHVEACFAQPIGGAFQVGAILFHLFGFSELELIKIPGYPTISNMDEQEMGMHQASHPLDMWQEAGICAAVLKGNQNFLIHASTL